MKIFRAWFILLLLPLQSFADDHPVFKNIVSINLCTDQLLYLLTDKKHIASISYLGADDHYSALAKELSQFPLNNANIEQIISYHPDLVLASTYDDKQTLNFLKHLHYRVETISLPQDMHKLQQGILTMGELLGEETRAKTLVEDMRRRQTIATSKIADKPRPLAVILAPDGYTHGQDSMNGDLLEMAGYRNLAAEKGIIGDGNLTLESILAAQPDFMIIEDSTPNNNSLSQRLLQHPALLRGLPNMRKIYLPPNLWTCAGPSVIDALEILVEAHP